MESQEVRLREAYCTICKQNVCVVDATYNRLANRRAIIRGQCSKCGSELIKASIMPRSSARIFRRRKKKGKGVLPNI